MDKNARDFFDRLLTTPGVSGYEQPVQAVVREYVAAFADEVHTDLHGNVIAIANPDGAPRLMLDAHCDQLGMLTLGNHVWPDRWTCLLR